MTVVVAVKGEWKTWMVSDDATDAGAMRYREPSKIWQPFPNLAIGGAGEHAALTKFFYHDWEFLPPGKGFDAARWAWTNICQPAKELFGEVDDMELLMCIGKELVIVDGTWAPHIEDSEYAAVGVGAPFALGSLHRADNDDVMGLSLEDAQRAVQAAEYFCPLVGALRPEVVVQW